MAASPPRPAHGRRPRRRPGALERPVSGHIYRRSLTLVALPLLLLAFTVARPEALPKPSLPPSFDAGTAAQLAEEFAGLFPDRSLANPQRGKALEWLRDGLEAYGLEVREQRFTAQIEGVGRVELENLVARPLSTGPRRSPRTIAVLADWDNPGVTQGLDRNASGIGALLELARDFSTITATHTIVFVATDAGSYGSVGAAALARDPAFRETALAVVNLDSLGGGPIRLLLAGEGHGGPSGTMLATADSSILRQTGYRVRHAGVFSQLLDLAFPFTLYGQGPPLGAGIAGVTLTTAGDAPPDPADDPVTLDVPRLQTVGRAAQSLVGSLDSALEAAAGTEAYVYRGGRVFRGFAIALLLIVLLVAPTLATVDLYARLRRRGMPFAPAARSLRVRLGAWLGSGIVAVVFTALGLFPNGGDRPLSPYADAARQWPSASIAGLVLLAGALWFVARIRLVPSGPVDRLEELAGHVTAMLLLCAVAIGLAIVNIYSVALVLPALHLWLYAPNVRDRSPLLRALVLVLGFAGPIALVASFAVRLRLGFDAPWYVASLFTVGYAPWELFVLALGFGAAAAQVGAFLFGRYAPDRGSGTGGGMLRRARGFGRLPADYR